LAEKAKRQIAAGGQEYVATIYDPLSDSFTVLSPPGKEKEISIFFDDSPAVSIGSIEITDMARNSDTSPFWGGGLIIRGNSTCSAGFSAKAGTAQVMVTAKHCGTVDSSWTSGANVAFGKISKHATNSVDAAYIKDKSYAGKIFTGGTTSNSSKAVSGAGDPTIGNTYCASGQNTGWTCTHKAALSMTFSGLGPANAYVLYYYPVLAGDSGGAIVSDGTKLTVRGIVKGSAVITTGYPGDSARYDYLVGPKWSVIKSGLGLDSVVTG
jgi:hypothetical protein